MVEVFMNNIDNQEKFWSRLYVQDNLAHIDGRPVSKTCEPGISNYPVVLVSNSAKIWSNVFLTLPIRVIYSKRSHKVNPPSQN